MGFPCVPQECFTPDNTENVVSQARKKASLLWWRWKHAEWGQPIPHTPYKFQNKKWAMGVWIPKFYNKVNQNHTHTLTPLHFFSVIIIVTKKKRNINLSGRHIQTVCTKKYWFVRPSYPNSLYINGNMGGDIIYVKLYLPSGTHQLSKYFHLVPGSLFSRIDNYHG